MQVPERERVSFQADTLEPPLACRLWGEKKVKVRMMIDGKGL